MVVVIQRKGKMEGDFADACAVAYVYGNDDFPHLIQ